MLFAQMSEKNNRFYTPNIVKLVVRAWTTLLGFDGIVVSTVDYFPHLVAIVPGSIPAMYKKFVSIYFCCC